MNGFLIFKFNFTKKFNSNKVFIWDSLLHWYMYILHDTRYLASKGQSRKYHYSHSDIVASDYNNLNYLSKSIDMLKLSPYSSMLDAQKQGLSWQEYFMRGGIPIQQLNLFEKAWYLLLREDTYRNGRQGHL